jgi:xanthine dehydrogenase small subunit
VPLKNFFAAYRKTILQPGEIIASIRIPKPLPEFVRFYKVTKRKLDDISTVAACLAMSLDSAGRVEKARFAYGGVAEIPLRILGAEQAIEGRRWSTSTALLAQEEIARAVRPISDHRGSAAYRLAMAKSLVEKFAWETLEKAA